MADQITDIIDILNDWKDIEYETFSEVCTNAAKQAVTELKSTSPAKTGDYRKGWKVKKVNKKNGVFEVTVYNKTDYQLTHLLEYGHAKIIGGRNLGTVKAYPHIEQAEQNAINKVESELRIKL